MAIRKLLNALSLTVGEGINEGREAPVDTSIATDDPRLIAGALMGASNVSLHPRAGRRI